MTRYHMPRGYGCFISGASLITWCTMGLLFVLVSWAVGGSDFKDSIFGDAAMMVFVAGVALGALLTAWAQRHGHRDRG